MSSARITCAPRPSSHQWRERDIAFLKPSTCFCLEDYNALIKPAAAWGGRGYMPEGATGHPVIILRRVGNHVLVTPVSAYSSGDYNNNLAPWNQKFHRRKCRYDFRSFDGTELASNDHPALFLERGSMPKPKVSWVYIQSVWVVPVSVITHFTKSRQLLRLRQDSLASLCRHMAERCWSWAGCQQRLELLTACAAASQPRALEPTTLLARPKVAAKKTAQETVPTSTPENAAGSAAPTTANSWATVAAAPVTFRTGALLGKRQLSTGTGCVPVAWTAR